jgi:hypothetical protein
MGLLRQEGVRTEKKNKGEQEKPKMLFAHEHPLKMNCLESYSLIVELRSRRVVI